MRTAASFAHTGARLASIGVEDDVAAEHEDPIFEHVLVIDVIETFAPTDRGCGRRAETAGPVRLGVELQHLASPTRMPAAGQPPIHADKT